MISLPNKRFITCGMYAFTNHLQQAWQSLFDEFLCLWSKDSIEPDVLFSTDFETLRSPALFLGHTCGYPLMKFLQQACQPVCVPVFDVDGCTGRFYSSHFIAHIDSNIDDLSQCHNHIAAINGPDSNSGMNVLRYAVSQTGIAAPFFSDVIISGSHLNSLRAVANGEATIAAIDSVSFALIKDNWPELASQVKTIGNSAITCGLPFVIPASQLNSVDSEQITISLNQALSGISSKHRSTLHLIKFETVVQSDYQSIVDLENRALKAKYPKLI